ncbi:MAG: 1-acyl-sn-glycerol-3-phosphate acyltransferase [Tannerella sp.]|jgi:1-acyl-sn-glycerol-3-phosphate acyltransferase|nr:1-acyl-sn-glycerol-3-phosphate acyltransferase [Tannerella sp.]
MIRFFLSIYDYFTKHKGQLFGLLSLLVILFTVATTQIRFKEDISGFLPEDKENERINNAYRYVASANNITVYCTGIDSTFQTKDLQIEAIGLLADKLSSLDSGYIKRLFYKVDPTQMSDISSFVVNNMPYFLDESDYQRLDTLLTDAYISDQMERSKDILLSPVGLILKENVLADPLGISNTLMRKLQDFQVGSQFKLYQDHVFTGDNKGFLLIECNMPVSETVRNAEFIDSLNVFMSDVEASFDGKVQLSSFGASEIGLGNASQIKKDSIMSSVLAFVLIFAILIYAFRSSRKIIFTFVSVLFGGLFALAFMYLIRGEVSVIAIGISSIMFGIAINYPLHFIDHYNHIPHSRIVIKDIFEPLTIGNITTVGAFLSLVFIASDAMIDLGLFASLLLVGTIFFVLIFLPHMLPDRTHVKEVRQPTIFVRAFDKSYEKNRWVVWGTLLLTLILSFFSGNSQFETNMQNINYMTDAQQKEYQRMMELLNQSQQVVYYVTEGKDMEQALEANEALKPQLKRLMDEGVVARVGGVGNFYPSKAMQAERVERWNAFWNTRKDSTIHAIRTEAVRSGFKPEAFYVFEEMINLPWEIVELSHFDLIRELLAKNYLVETPDWSMVVNLLYTESSKALELESALNADNRSSIAFDAGSITRRMIASLSDNFNYVLYVCGFIVFAFLIFSMGRLELSLIAFIPLALSWIWILGLMNIFDIRFNIVNIILATFIFGQGDDYTIFITEGLMYEYTYRRKILTSYKNSIALSALIMFIGIGMLIFAKHPALRSLAEVTIVGMLSVVIMSFIFPSFLFRMLTVRKGRKRLMPVTLKNFLSTLYAFAFFLVMSLVITVYGWFLFAFGKVTEDKKMRYHRMLQRISKFVIYRIPQVKTTFTNVSGETFDKPSVIICNHQAHLDLMCVLMLTPKLIILTNDWVWNSPFYGRLIRYADFYPISNGIENALDQLQDAVSRGYSIVIFPEGTRSADCSIRRFRRGAFFLAEKLKLDIIPVMIHGVGHVLPKEEFMLRKGRIDIQVMDRISPDDARFSADYSLRSRGVRRFYQEHFQEWSKQLETAEYYSDLVIHNYIYKGPAIERSVRSLLRKHHDFKEVIGQLPDVGSVIVNNSGLGAFTLLLSLVKKQLQVIGIEKNADLRDLAANCASVPANLSYIQDESVLENQTNDMRLRIEVNDSGIKLTETIN